VERGNCLPSVYIARSADIGEIPRGDIVIDHGDSRMILLHCRGLYIKEKFFPISKFVFYLSQLRQKYIADSLIEKSENYFAVSKVESGW